MLEGGREKKGGGEMNEGITPPPPPDKYHSGLGEVFGFGLGLGVWLGCGIGVGRVVATLGSGGRENPTLGCRASY